MNQPGKGCQRHLRAGLFCALVVLVGSSSAHAQAIAPPAAEATAAEPSAPDTGVEGRTDAAPARERPAGGIGYVGPDTYILLDAEGRPQAMPGMTYEDFMAAWRELQRAGEKHRGPRYTIEALEIDGRAEQRHARLHLQLTIRLTSGEPVVVPLGLGSAILLEQPRFEREAGARERGSDAAAGAEASAESQPAEPYLHYDAEQGGFVAGLAGRAGERFHLSLELLVPLTQSSLQLKLPRAVTAKLSLDVPEKIASATATGGAAVSQEPLAGAGTRLNAVGMAGPFALSWNVAESVVREPATVLSATGAITITIDGRSVQSEARLAVESYGGEFDRFRVRLPPGARLIEDGRQNGGTGRRESGLRVSVEAGSLAPEPGGAAGQERQTVLVELAEKEQGPVEVRLLTEQPLGLLGEASPVELSGFEVVGAVRQFGDVALRIADDWQVRWELGHNVRQVDVHDLATALQEPGITAAFQYDRQPWSLGVRMAARQYRLQVTPEYTMDCLADEARLRVRLTYQVLGARAFEFRVDLRGWELTADPIESGGLVDGSRVRQTREGMLELPLTQASPRRPEIAFTLRRSTPRDADRLELPLPVPQAEWTSGTLLVRPDLGVELMPDSERSAGIAAMPVTDTPDGPGSGDVDEFRFRCFSPEGVFVADRIDRPRDVVSEVAAQINLTEAEARVDQRIDYTVRFDSIRELAFEIPEELLASGGTIEAVLLRSAGGVDEVDAHTEVLLARAPISEGEELEERGGARLLRTTLPQPRMGRFTVLLRYAGAWPRDRLARSEFSIPLILPLDGRLAEQRAVVQKPRSLAVSLSGGDDDSSWQSAPPPWADDHAEHSTEFVATRGESVLPLTVRPIDFNLPSATTIDRVWLQTWLARGIRQDRAAFRFRSTASMVTVELPPETSADEVEVLLDGERARVAPSEAGRLVVWLSSPADERPMDSQRVRPASDHHTLELRYRPWSGEALVARRPFSPPQLVGMAALSEVYWHIVLPGDRHVVRSPQRLASASRWQWLGRFWGQRPARSQAELEEWVGATSAELAPTEAQNEYLYTGLAPVASIEVVTAPRWLIVLACSATALVLALTWIYVPMVRRGPVVVGLAVVLAGVAIVYPAPAVLLGQAAVLGVVLAALALVLARLAARPAGWIPSAVGGGSSLRQPTPRAESALLSPLSVASGTSPMAPAHVPDSES